MEWTHDSLMDDLAGHLKSPNTLVWRDMQLGPAGSPRPDVYRMNKSFTHPHPLAYECKVSRSDFLSDVTSGKWVSYLKYAYGVIFSVPAGLVSAKEIPEKCGLLYRHENVWRAAKRPIIEPHPIPQDAWIKLLIDGVHREGPVLRRKHWNDWASSTAFAKRFGAEAARWIHDSAGLKERIERVEEEIKTMYQVAEKQAKRTRDDALSSMPQMWENLIQTLGVPQDSDKYAIQSAINEIRNTKFRAKDKNALRLLDSITTQIGNMRRYFEPDDGEAGGEG